MVFRQNFYINYLHLGHWIIETFFPPLHIDRHCCHQTSSKRYGKVFQSMDWDTIKVDSRSTKQQAKSLMPWKSCSVLQWTNFYNYKWSEFGRIAAKKYALILRYSCILILGFGWADSENRRAFTQKLALRVSQVLSASSSFWPLAFFLTESWKLNAQFCYRL